MTTQNRRAFVQKLIEKAIASGHPIDRDLEFMALVDLWIEGTIDMADMRVRFRSIRDQRVGQRSLERAADNALQMPEAAAAFDELASEIERMSDASGYRRLDVKA